MKEYTIVYIVILTVICDVTSNVLYFRTMNKMLDFKEKRLKETLTCFIDRVVNPDTKYLKQCGETIDSVADILKSERFDYKVMRVIKVCIAFTVL